MRKRPFVSFDDVLSSRSYKKSQDLAEKLAREPDRIEKLLTRLEEKLKKIPGLGGALSNIPVFVSLIRSYLKGEYTDLPLSSLITILTALIYFVSPIDFIPDIVPMFGLLDDAAAVAIAMKAAGAEVERYKVWCEERDKRYRVEYTVE